MTLELDGKIIDLVYNYEHYEGDESYVFQLATYVVGKLREQHPDLFEDN